jgi:basic membrane protein A and related proteins
MKNKRSLLMVLLSVLALSIVPMFKIAAQDSLIESVCLITDVGRVNDGTFNQFAYEGMLRAAEDFSLENTFVETTAQTDYINNIDTCIGEGYDVIVTVGFLMADATVEAANANPNTYFVGVDQFVFDNPDTADVNEAPTNLVGVQFREDQAGFLVGAMAALMSESGTIAGVYGIDIPPVKKFRNGYEQGAQYVNPDLVPGETILGVYIDSFGAPDRGAAAAEQFIGEGADVIFGAGGPTGSGGITAAASQGVYGIGVDQDEYFSTFGSGETPGAEFLITSALKRVDQAVYLSLEALVASDVDGFGGGGVRVLSAFNNGVGFAPAHDSDVPAEVTAAIEEILVGLQTGTIVTGVDPVSGDLLGTTSEVAANAGMFSTLLAAATAAGLVETLDTGGPFTIFAPTDEAFAAFLAENNMTAEEVLADTEALTAILTYHVVPAALDSDMVAAALIAGEGTAAVPTVQGEEVTVTVTDMGIMVDQANLVAVDVYSANAVIHVIDAVLVPPSMSE